MKKRISHKLHRPTSMDYRDYPPLQSDDLIGKILVNGEGFIDDAEQESDSWFYWLYEACDEKENKGKADVIATENGLEIMGGCRFFIIMLSGRTKKEIQEKAKAVLDTLGEPIPLKRVAELADESG